MPKLGQEYTFESFVVGPANRLASAAARRAAETPGSAYNPLFIYSTPGLGKTHILGAISHQVATIHPDKKILYQTLQDYLGDLAKAVRIGTEKRFRDRYTELDVFLLDDVQFLAGELVAQEMLLQTVDSLTSDGGQVVFSSDRPPGEVKGLDPRLRTRFEGGLLVEIGAPEYETQMAIIRRVTEARDQRLDSGVADIIGRSGVENVRELTGALNRVLALQELEGRVVAAVEAAAMLQEEQELPDLDGTELGQFLEEISDTVAAQVDAQEAPWRKLLRDTIGEAEEEDFKADSLRRLLQQESPADDVGEVTGIFKRTLRELKEIKEELELVGNPWPEAAFGVLRDPERLEEARALLHSARERTRPFPDLPEGPSLEGLKKDLPKAVLDPAGRLVHTLRAEYNPLFAWSPGGEAARILLTAAARSCPEGARVALISLAGFAEEFNQALSGAVAGAWRERWWVADFLFLSDVHELSGTERVQDEVVHLLDAVRRRKGRIMVSADRPPAELGAMDDRLRTRLDGGLILEVPVPAADLRPELLEPDPSANLSTRSAEEIAAQDREWIRSFATLGATREGETLATGTAKKGLGAVIAAATAKAGGVPPQGVWAPTAENVILDWPELADRIIEEPD
jgi:chromosomal replication initiation ATPase DnaA